MPQAPCFPQGFFPTLLSMKKLGLMALAALTLLASSYAQSPQSTVGTQVAGLREDVRILIQRVGALSLRIEQLERENAALLRSTDGMDKTYATVSDLNAAVAELNQAMSSGDANTQARAAKAIQELARETNAAVASVAKGVSAARAISTPTFDDNFEKSGLTYTIQKGDTLSSIASRFKSSVKDIRNANKIVDPTKIQVGQNLFIPGGE